jgi:hypothetical protein
MDVSASRKDWNCNLKRQAGIAWITPADWNDTLNAG